MEKARKRAPLVNLKRAAELMLDGHPVIFPTETFFALGSRALDADATARVFRAKHRSTVRPLPLILGEWNQLDLIAKTPDGILPLLERFWPGPLSVIFPARLRVPDILTGGTRPRRCTPVLAPRGASARAGGRRTHHLKQRQHQREPRGHQHGTAGPGTLRRGLRHPRRTSRAGRGASLHPCGI